MSNAPIIDVTGYLVDITDTLADLAPEDRVYRTANGYVVKVKALFEPLHGEFGRNGNVGRVHLSGSICGEDGKALRRSDGETPAVWSLEYIHHFMAHGDDDAEASLEKARASCVAQTIRAEKTHQVLTSHTEGARAGLVTKGQQVARKAAEAATPQERNP